VSFGAVARNCETCHVGFNFTDENYNNLGVGMVAKQPDLGYYAISKLEGYKGAFKTPTLREIACTAPYMHDGSQKTWKKWLPSTRADTRTNGSRPKLSP
jgi:cytochrome c peroxidase